MILKKSTLSKDFVTPNLAIISRCCDAQYGRALNKQTQTKQICHPLGFVFGMLKLRVSSHIVKV